MTLRRTGLTRSIFDTPSPFGRDRADGGGGASKRQADQLTGDDDDDAGDMGDDDGDDDADEDGDDADEGDDAPQSPTKPDGTPYTQQDIDNLREALRKERRANRASKKGKKDDADEPDADELRAEVENEVGGKWKAATVRTAARSALTAAGLMGKPDRLLRLLDLDDIEIDFDDDGDLDIDGLDEQIADLKKDYPHLFQKKKGKLDAAAGRDDRGSDGKRKSASEIQAEQLLGTL